jgi:site-specific recombinase XerD
VCLSYSGDIIAYVNDNSQKLVTPELALVPVVVGVVSALAHPLPSDRHPVAVYLAHLASGSRRTMGQALQVIAALFGRTPETLDWSQLRYQHTQAIRTRLAESRSPAGTNKMLAALRGVLKEAWRLGLMTAEDYHRATDLPGVRGERLPRGRALSRRELQKLFAACANDASAIGRRDAALLAVMYAGGLRRSEVVGLDLGDYVAITGELRVRDGKGRKERLAYATDGAKLALDAWLAVRGDEAGPLFWPADGRGRALMNRRMTDQAVLLLLRRRASQGKVAPFTPHDLRRSFISDLLDAGADMVTVQKLAGHANVQTTARYDRRGEEVKRRAAELLSVPFVAA